MKIIEIINNKIDIKNKKIDFNMRNNMIEHKKLLMIES